MNDKRMPKVEQALDWAFRSGYSFAKIAAQEYTEKTDTAFTIGDLGLYGEKLTFHDSPEAARKAAGMK